IKLVAALEGGTRDERLDPEGYTECKDRDDASSDLISMIHAWQAMLEREGPNQDRHLAQIVGFPNPEMDAADWEKTFPRPKTATRKKHPSVFHVGANGRPTSLRALVDMLENVAKHFLKDNKRPSERKDTRDLARSLVCDIIARWMHLGHHMPMTENVLSWCRRAQRTTADDEARGRAYLLTDFIIARAWIAERMRVRLHALVQEVQQVSGHVPNGRLFSSFFSSFSL
ncbi:MAG: hypothetical protein GY737_18940, partial [Desulfobacteraceae bacterium]|nr:hypothetical protein [Desulfobacteraceae bacterium]